MNKLSLFASIFLLGCACAQSPGSSQPATGVQPAPSSASAAQPPRIDPAKEAAIRRLLDVTGVKLTMAQVMDNMTASLKPTLIQALPPGDYRGTLVDLFFAKLQSKIDTAKLLDLIVPIYDKYLSDDEIKGLIQFYQTPLGQKAVKVLPQLTNDSMQAGEKWGENLGRDSMVEVLSEHPDLKKAVEEAKQTAPQQ